MTTDNINVVFSLEDDSNAALDQCGDEALNEWLSKHVDNIDMYHDLMVSHTINYTENYTIKDLLLICDYYGCSKGLKSKKRTKEDIVNFLVAFETNPSNNDIVCKRKNVWFYIGELKNDKFMKKYVLW